MNNVKFKNRLQTSKFNKSLPLTLLVLPCFVYMVIFKYLPMFGLVLPFKNMSSVADGFFNSEWCGLANFEFVFSGSDAFVALRNTILYNFAFIIMHIIIGVAVALMLYELSAKSVKIYQTLIFLPYFISWVVGAYVVLALLNYDYGVVNHLLQKVGIKAINWYGNPKYWPWIIVIIGIWKGMGYNIVLYYAALVGIDPEYYEAAQLAGATKFQQIWYISIPMIKKIIAVLFILNVGKIMHSDFGLFYNVPLNISSLRTTTDVMDTYVYRTLMKVGDVGMSSAAAFFQSTIGFLLVIGTNIIVKRIDEDSSLF